MKLNWIHANLIGLSLIGIAIMLTCWRMFVFLKQRKHKKKALCAKNPPPPLLENEFISLIDASQSLNNEGYKRLANNPNQWKYYLDNTPHYQHKEDMFAVFEEETRQEKQNTKSRYSQDIKASLHLILIACINNELALWGEHFSTSSGVKINIPKAEIKNFNYEFTISHTTAQEREEKYKNFCFKNPEFKLWRNRVLDDITHSSK